ncbi:MAG: hypothetical protein AB1489_18675 [Acidobacteriota bacterium]
MKRMLFFVTLIAVCMSTLFVSQTQLAATVKRQNERGIRVLNNPTMPIKIEKAGVSRSKEQTILKYSVTNLSTERIDNAELFLITPGEECEIVVDSFRQNLNLAPASTGEVVFVFDKKIRATEQPVLVIEAANGQETRWSVAAATLVHIVKANGGNSDTYLGDVVTEARPSKIEPAFLGPFCTSCLDKAVTICGQGRVKEFTCNEFFKYCSFACKCKNE